MPIENLVPVTSEQTWTLVTGTRPGCLTDDSDATFVRSSTLDDYEIYRFGAMTATAASINGATMNIRIKHETNVAGISSVHWHVGVGISSNDEQTTTAAFVDDTSALARFGGGSFQPSDFTDTANHWWGVKLSSAPAADKAVLSEMDMDVDYAAPAGAFSFLLNSWIPPLLAVASHGLLKREIAALLSNLKIRPSSQEDFVRILEAFKRRPVYGI